MSINYHWMIKNKYSRKELEDTISAISEYGYMSVLLPFQINKYDPLICSSMLANKDQNIKFMIAVRPYTISALHLSIMCKTFYEFYGDKLIINFVAGTYDEEEFAFTGKYTSIDERKKTLRKFIKEFKGYFDQSYIPQIAISGFSTYSIETLHLFGDISIALMEDFEKNKNILLRSNKRLMIRSSLILGNKENDYIFQNEKEKNNCIVGSEDEIIEKIKYLNKNGVSDLLISGTYDIKNDKKIHDFILNYRYDI